MSNKYSEFEQNLNPGSHLLNLDDETWEEVNEYLVSGKGDELLVAVRESLRSGEFEIPDNEPEESNEENRSQAKLYTFPEREKSEGSDEDQKLIEYLPESSREHEVIGKWIRLMKDQEKGLIPIDKTKDITLSVIWNWITKLHLYFLILSRHACLIFIAVIKMVLRFMGEVFKG